MRKQYIVKLSNEERQKVHTIVRTGKRSARVIARARILLACDRAEADAAIAAAEAVHWTTIRNIRVRYAAGGLDRALFDARRPGTPPALDDRAEAFLVATACSLPPEGAAHWTLTLLRERLLKKQVVSHVSIGTIHARLTERGIKPWREKNVVHPLDR